MVRPLTCGNPPLPAPYRTQPAPEIDGEATPHLFAATRRTGDDMQIFLENCFPDGNLGRGSGTAGEIFTPAGTSRITTFPSFLTSTDAAVTARWRFLLRRHVGGDTDDRMGLIIVDQSLTKLTPCHA